MEIRLSPDQSAQLAELAVRNGRTAEQLVAEAVARFLDEEQRFAEAVHIGIEAADRGDFVPAEEICRAAAKQLGASEMLARVRAIQAQIAAQPVLDDRSPDEIIGYNEHGNFERW